MATNNKIDLFRIPCLFKNMEGLWNLERSVTGTPGQATMSGKGRFQIVEQNVLHYHEEGKLHLANGRYYEAFRRYVYQLEEETIRVYFSDGANTGQLFHALEFVSIHNGWPVAAIGFHQCSPDQYNVGYEFLEPDKFRITYRVAGKRKNYVSATMFSRLR